MLTIETLCLLTIA